MDFQLIITKVLNNVPVIEGVKSGFGIIILFSINYKVKLKVKSQRLHLGGNSLTLIRNE